MHIAPCMVIQILTCRPNHWLNCKRHVQYADGRQGTVAGRPKASGYFLDMFHCHPCIFPCVFLNLWSQEKTSPYRKTTFLSLFFLNHFHLSLVHWQKDKNSQNKISLFHRMHTLLSECIIYPLAFGLPATVP